MKTEIIYIILFLVSSISISQNKTLNFSLLRQNDNIDTLQNNQSKNRCQKFKYTPLGNYSMLSFGGSWRFQSESFFNEQFQNTLDQDNLWYLNRVMLHAHLKIKNKIQLFAKVNTSLIENKEDELLVNQLFVSYKPFPKWSIDFGRQNLKLGSGRLVDVREGPNVRRSFDLTQINYNSKKFIAKVFLHYL